MPTPIRVLLIDDDAVDRASVRRALRASSALHSLVEAVDGATGLQAARDSNFDCVLLDFRLPDADAFELLAALISPEGGRQAVIMLTGEVDQELALSLMRAGALDYLSKADVSPSNLARAIRYAKARRAFVSELQSAREDAEAKSRALDSLNRQKTLLLSIIAHDLRNPFHVLLGMSKTLKDSTKVSDAAAVERRANGIHEAATQANALIEGLFSWASLQMDSRSLELVPVDLESVARDCVQAFQERAAEKSIEVTTQCSGLNALGQVDMVAAILRNLVTNALKFTLPGGKVRIEAESRAGQVELSVSDTGVGMTPEQAEQLFQVERRSSTPGTAGERGSGLGLLLCRDLVEMQGGALDVQSEPGKGARFSFCLPSATDLSQTSLSSPVMESAAQQPGA